MLTHLDSPVPQKVEQLVAVLARFDAPIPEQVIEVPKISCPPRFSRIVLRTPQMAEQLVEVPVPSVLEVTIMAPFVDTAGRTWYWDLKAGWGRGGWRVQATTRGLPRKGSPPAQGGKRILGTATLADPWWSCTTSPSSCRSTGRCTSSSSTELWTFQWCYSVRCSLGTRQCCKLWRCRSCSSRW